MLKSVILASAVALAVMPAAASAATFVGDTTGGPTWNRPLSGTPPTTLSGVGTATPYEVLTFSVSASGDYDFLSTATGGWDNFLFLYQTSFDPLNQFANVIIGNDDFPNIGVSGFNNVALLTGTSYLAVSSGFSNDSFGAYTLEITGPGAIIPGAAVPEPMSWALMVVGFAAIGHVMRRRQTMAVSFG